MTITVTIEELKKYEEEVDKYIANSLTQAVNLLRMDPLTGRVDYKASQEAVTAFRKINKLPKLLVL